MTRQSLADATAPEIKAFSLQTYRDGRVSEQNDELAVEEPLEIQVVAHEDGLRIAHSISVTMRTPGQDRELALGFLFTENVILDGSLVEKVSHLTNDDERCNVIQVFLKEGAPFDPEKLSRHVFTSSSCGICGKVTIEKVRSACMSPPKPGVPISRSVLLDLPNRLNGAQSVFRKTGGLHASGLFDATGNIIVVREDVGRHNALDKIIGFLFEAKQLPAENTILLLSGRISFELIQKAVLAGIPSIAAVGAPSSLAVELAREFDITLIGFLRDGRFNIYHDPLDFGTMKQRKNTVD